MQWETRWGSWGIRATPEPHRLTCTSVSPAVGGLIPCQRSIHRLLQQLSLQETARWLGPLCGLTLTVPESGRCRLPGPAPLQTWRCTRRFLSWRVVAGGIESRFPMAPWGSSRPVSSNPRTSRFGANWLRPGHFCGRHQNTRLPRRIAWLQGNRFQYSGRMEVSFSYRRRVAELAGWSWTDATDTETPTR